MPAIGDKIVRNDYNTQQTTISDLYTEMGVSALLVSGAVSVGTKIQISQLSNLRTDIAKLKLKVSNSAPSGTLASAGGKITADYWNSQATDVSTVNSSKRTISDSQADTSTNTRTTGYFNSTYTTQYRFNFGLSDARKYFFNQGGQLVLNMGTAEQNQSPYAGTTKATAYQSLANSMGTMRVNLAGGPTTWSISSTTLTDQAEVSAGGNIVVFTTSGNYPSNTATVSYSIDREFVYLSIAFNDVSGANPNVDEQIRFTGQTYGFRAVKTAVWSATTDYTYRPTASVTL